MFPPFRAAALPLAAVGFCAALFSPSVIAQSAPVIGSSNPAVADAPLVVPATTPITVPLFTNHAFADFNSETFTYTPPVSPIKHWAKIVLVADLSVSAGRQFDRTAIFSIGHTNIFYGTTAEPSRLVSPAWHIERDITDLSALLATSQPGEADIGNVVDSTYTGIIYGSAKLLFYPPDAQTPAPVTPDVVLSIPSTGGGFASINTPTDTLTETYTFPTNVVRAYLDVITQSQNADEFWYFGVPNDLTGELESSGNTAFREAEISVDGGPAGVAPVYPWIYTGGIDPYLWRPIPGVQTLNFVPYRVDLTPFAALLNDGQPHSVGIRVFNNNNYFLVAGTLLLYCDPSLTHVTGALTANTLADDPVPVIATNLKTSSSGEVTGPVSVTSLRTFQTAGYVMTSAGKVTTTIKQTVAFSSVQQFDVSAVVDGQKSQQQTYVSSLTTTHSGAGTQTRSQLFYYPLSLDYLFLANADGTYSQTTKIGQGYQAQDSYFQNNSLLFSRLVSEEVTPADTLLFDSGFNITGKQGQESAATYFYGDTHGNHFFRTLSAADGVLTSVYAGQNVLGQ